MTRKERLLTAWQFKEPDRVPIELLLYPTCEDLPGADAIRAFQEQEATNFLGAHLFDWGFMGLETQYTEATIEDVPGSHIRKRRVHETPVGTFTAITKHTYEDLFGDGDKGDFHWEKRFIETLDDFKRLADAPRERRRFDLDAYNTGCATIGDRGLPCTGLLHPLGTLVRNSHMSEAYMWLLTEDAVVETFLARCTEQICDSLLALEDQPLADPPVFRTYAIEMLIPPWFGTTHFDRLVVPYDKQVNDVVHAIGGRHFAHCHGNSGGFLERFADMGIDALDPLEPSPYGDNLLADVKRRVGRRMLLCGNIPSQIFYLDATTPETICGLVKQAIEEGAPGGGFTLRATGSAYVGNGKTRAQKIKSIECGLAMIDAWREFG